MTNNKKHKVALSILTVGLAFTLTGCTFSEKPQPTTQESTTETTTTTTTSTTAPTTTTPTIEVITTSEPDTENIITDVVTTLPITSEPTSAEDKEDTVTVWAKSDANVREKNIADSKIIGVLHEGNGITLVEKTSDGWSKVIFEDNEAYIRSSLLTDKEPSRTVSSDRILVDPNTDLWYLVVVDTKREIPSDYVPKLAEVASSGKYMDARVAPYYNDMYAAAKKDGITLTPYSGYRSYARQQRNYNNLTNTYMSQYNLSKAEAAKKAATVILPPGTSEHNLGLAMDICNTNSTFSSQKEYKWLMEHAHEYGFILRYTADKQPITGIIPEPWHWRFVGVEHAKKIKDSGLCLEEYLEREGIAY